DMAAGQFKEARILLCDPKVSAGVLRDALHGATRNSRDGPKPVIRQVAKFPIGGNPNSPLMILEKRIRSLSVQFPVVLAVRDNSSVFPPVQTTARGEPDGLISVCQNGHGGTRQTLLHRKRGDRKIPKAVEAALRGHPDIAFVIFKQIYNVVARQAV